MYQKNRYTQRTPAPQPKRAAVKGDPNLWVTLQAVSGTQGTKTTRAMSVPGGVVLSVTIQSAGAIATSLAFVPGVGLTKTPQGHDLAPL